MCVSYTVVVKRTFILLAVLGVVALGIWYANSQNSSTPTDASPTSLPANNVSDEKNGSGNNVPLKTVITENLDTPWGIAFLPTSAEASAGELDGGMLVTERKGTVRLITATGELQSDPIATLGSVREIGEGGLLGIELHPNFTANNFVYFYYTYKESGGNTLNRVVRMTYKENRLSDEQVLVDSIPGASNHNGGRIKFGPDKLLYVATGDAQEPSRAQDKNSLAGKILRVTDLGKPAPGNPFGNEVYSYGHRNVQGLAWDSRGQLWATEHGRSGIQSGLDEINRIEPGKNYGWPDIEGNEQSSGMETPVRNSGSTTWAPAGAAFIGNFFYFGGLRGTALYEAAIAGNTVTEVKEHLTGEYGRIRDVVTGPDGMLYITTSNQDGRGRPDKSDDKIIRVNPTKL